MKKWIFLICILLPVQVWGGTGSAPSSDAGPILFAQKAMAMAGKHMDLDQDAACLTNARSSFLDKVPARAALDEVTRKTGISLGRGNLLLVHEPARSPLWMAFVSRRVPDRLVMVLISSGDSGPVCSSPVNIKVEAGTDFGLFNKEFGKKAFSLVTLANGWADHVPMEILDGALFHDHLCCGVFTGYFTAEYILAHMPLGEEEKYIYLGAPAWCQDDLIQTFLNLTPGKHGYGTMAYPWSRPWTTSEKAYPGLGGIIIRHNPRTGTGKAWVLGFDWQPRAFEQFLARPGFVLDWKKNPWLHVAYNRFFMQHLARPETFVSVVGTKEIENKADLQRLIRMGANPLEEILGPDPSWTEEFSSAKPNSPNKEKEKS
ncbi:FmdE family protein [Desulfospira joergensenii]|uniref:FmdE family protein n=1 Tax=Desulfospira joergensenii TaxID=53329 RepID=UPI0003B7A3E4|nr:FmdE family protein [Desulfospira joergensenii]